ncbi:hypothetical protein OK016_05945 [Vibrio chagasii]|nr:hypothetical protein [Vibrio chagasii]
MVRIRFFPRRGRGIAGQSSFAGRERCNDCLYWIELEGSDFIAYTERGIKP